MATDDLVRDPPPPPPPDSAPDSPPPDPIPDPPPPPDPLEYAAYLDGIVRLSVAAKLRGVSVDTMRREGIAKRLELIPMTDSMVGCRRRDALKLSLPGRGGRRKAGGRKSQG
jgi:hypothetical protein